MNWIKIENLSDILDNFRPKVIHPDSPLWLPHWKSMRAKLINGIWVEQFGKWRYISGVTGFYGVFFRFLDWDEEGNRLENCIPKIRDLELHRHYYYAEMLGFSGYEDSKYTSDRIVLDADNLKFVEKAFPNRYKNLINSDGSYKEYIDPRENLFKLHESPQGIPLYYNDKKNHLEKGSRGGGKMTPVDVPVLTTKGWINMGDLEVGDFTYGRDGKPTKIIEIHPQGVQQVWKVFLQDGRFIECGDSHLWTVRKPSNIEVVISTEDMYNGGLTYYNKKGNIYKYQIPNCKPIDYDKKELPINPYILGCLLGDGALTTSTPKIASSDKFILDYFKKHLKGFTLIYDKTTTNNYTIVDNNKKVITVNNRWGTTHEAKLGNRLAFELKKLKLNVSCKYKFIPELYKTSSYEQRIELLQGLIDSDGCVSTSGSIEFTNTCETLVDDVAEICRSLGIRCQKSIDNREGQPHTIKGHTCTRGKYFRLYINTTKLISKLPRKRERIKNKKRTNSQDFVSIVKIEKTNIYKEQQCIAVDNEDHTYITKDHIVTHNTYSWAGIILHQICFSAAKRYNINGSNPQTVASIEVTSAGGGKASDLLEKVEYALDALLKEENLAATGGYMYDDGREDNIEPMPFWKKMSGSYSANNRESKNKKAGGWKAVKAEVKDKYGNWYEPSDGAVVYNTTYSKNSKTGGTKSAGGRRTLVLNEELGENELLGISWSSNQGLVSDNGVQKAPQVGIGTSSLNQEVVAKSREIMLNPKTYNCLEFKQEGIDNPTCFFFGIQNADTKFKDENGNTDVEASTAYHKSKLDKLIEDGADEQAVNGHKVNNPIDILDMYEQANGNWMPSAEASKRLKMLIREPSLPKYITFEEDINHQYGKDYTILNKSQVYPFTQFPYGDRKDLEGAIEMFIEPESLYIGKEIPKDAVWLFIDPYKSEDWKSGGSLGSIIVWVNPKYADYGLPVNQIAATYYGKPAKGLDGFTDIISDLHDIYGQGIGNVWYEDNIGGEEVRFKFILKNKRWALCARPQFKNGRHIFNKKTTQTGYNVSNNKGILWKETGQLLKSRFTWNENDMQTEDLIINKISSIFLLNQIKESNKNMNLDAVSALQALPLALGEQKARESMTVTTKTNYFSKGIKRMKYER